MSHSNSPKTAHILVRWKPRYFGSFQYITFVIGFIATDIQAHDLRQFTGELPAHLMTYIDHSLRVIADFDRFDNSFLSST